MASVHPAHRCTSPLGVVPVGWGDGVGHCRDAASFPENGPLISLGFLSGAKLCLFFRSMVFVSTWVYATMMHIRWVSLRGHVGEERAKSL